MNEERIKKIHQLGALAKRHKKEFKVLRMKIAASIIEAGKVFIEMEEREGKERFVRIVELEPETDLIRVRQYMPAVGLFKTPDKFYEAGWRAIAALDDYSALARNVEQFLEEECCV